MWRFYPVPVLLASLWHASCGCEAPDLSCGGGAIRASSCPSYVGASCNAVGVDSGLRLVLPELSEGRYVLSGTADGEAFSCDVEVTAGVRSYACDGAPMYEAMVMPGDIFIKGVPCKVTVELRRGEHVVVAGGTYRPDYRWDEPWGENCDFRGYGELRLDGSGGPITEGPITEP